MYKKTTCTLLKVLNYAIALVFFSEGLQKFLTPEKTGAGRFSKIGFEYPELWAWLVGGLEILCAIILILIPLQRIATLVLLVIMATAFITTKIPLLSSEGFWAFAHGYRTDFFATVLLVLMLRYGGVFKKENTEANEKQH